MASDGGRCGETDTDDSISPRRDVPSVIGDTGDELQGPAAILRQGLDTTVRVDHIRWLTVKVQHREVSAMAGHSLRNHY